MSSKKDNIRKDLRFLNMALNLAETAKYKTGSNPAVGCLVVKDDQIISFGVTNKNGRPHAEQIALNKRKFPGSTLYVSMEPCTHTGKTAPCTNFISNSRIKKVVYGANDIDPRTAFKSKKILRKKKILSYSYEKNKIFEKFYKDYFYHKKNQIPYVTGKIACSKDLFILSKKSKKITSLETDRIFHILRSNSHAIITSSRTANYDNPKLNCRLQSLEKLSPKRIIIDKDLKIKNNLYLINTAKKQKTIIFYNKSDKTKIKYLKSKGVILKKIKLNKNNQFDLKKILKQLYSMNISYILLECGRNLLQNFLRQNLINEFFLLKSKKKLGNNGRINIRMLKNDLSKYFSYSKVVEKNNTNDLILKYF